LKIAKVIPLHKKGSIHHAKNYRPISVLPVFSRILEKLMYNRLIPFLVENNVITDAQNGFRRKKSTNTARQTFIENIQEALDKGLHAIGILFDLTKAYDVINHDKLLDKLYSYGIRGETNRWFKTYLSNRYQFVEIGDTDSRNPHKQIFKSSRMKVKHGILQGSVLGPLLFLLYMNGITENVQGAKMVLFADNTNLLITGADEEDLQYKIKNVMRELNTWFEENKLIINFEKTFAMSFHPIQMRVPIRPQIRFNKVEITYKPELKFLGIYITEISEHSNLYNKNINRNVEPLYDKKYIFLKF
jgi:hypothetical protein